MGLFYKFKILNILVFSSFVALSISCSKKINNNVSTAQGGQDSGGGDTVGSTYGQVEYYFKNEKELKRSLNEILYNLINNNGIEYGLDGSFSKKQYTKVNAFQEQYPYLFSKLRESIVAVDFNDTVNEMASEVSRPETIVKEDASHKVSMNEFGPNDTSYLNPKGKENRKRLSREREEKFEAEYCKNLNKKECYLIKAKKKEEKKNEMVKEVLSKIEVRSKKYKKEGNITLSTDGPINYERLFPEQPVDGDNAIAQFPGPSPKISLENLIDQLKINLTYDDSCFDKYKNKKTASVENFSTSSSICVSIKELTKIAPESLEKQIHALLVHEIMHLLGFLEDDAQKIQKFLLENYDDYFRYRNLNYIVKKTLYSRAEQLKTSVDIILETYQPKDLKEKSDQANIGFIKNFKSIDLQSNDIEIVLDGYLISLEKKNLSYDKKQKIIAASMLFKNILNELKSLYAFIKKRSGEVRDCYDDQVATEMLEYQYYAPVDYQFIYNRLQILSDRLDYINNEFKSTNVLLERTP